MEDIKLVKRIMDWNNIGLKNQRITKKEMER